MLREEMGARRDPVEQERFDREIVEARSALGEAAFDAAFAEGRAKTMEYALGQAE